MGVRHAFKWLGSVFAVVLLGGCAFTFWPIIPEALPDQSGVMAVESLTRDGSNILVHVRLDRVPHEGFVSVFLYRDDAKVGEDSKLVTAGDGQEASFSFDPAVLGAYRAIVFFDGIALRQSELTVSAVNP